MESATIRAAIAACSAGVYNGGGGSFGVAGGGVAGGGVMGGGVMGGVTPLEGNHT